jgi:hypothetical protein
MWVSIMHVLRLKESQSRRLQSAARETLTIVFSIVAALQFQDWHRQWREAGLAREARFAIREELTRNRNDSYESLLRNVDYLRQIQPLLHGERGYINPDFTTPTILSAAWDSAIEMHAINAMPLAQAQAYAEIYKNQRDCEYIMQQTVPSFINAMLAYHPDDNVSRAAFLVGYQRILNIVISQNLNLLGIYDNALALKPVPVPSSLRGFTP